MNSHDAACSARITVRFQRKLPWTSSTNSSHHQDPHSISRRHQRTKETVRLGNLPGHAAHAHSGRDVKFVVLDDETLHSDDIGPVDIILVDEIHSPVVHPCKEWVMQSTRRWWLQQTAVWVQDTVSGNGDVLVVFSTCT